MLLFLLPLVLLLLVQRTACSMLLVMDNAQDHHERNALLLKQIEQIHLTTNADADRMEKLMTFRNASGDAYSCFATDTSSPAEAEASVEPEAAAAAAALPTFSQDALDARLPLLQDACLTYNAGWWTTRWCHASEAKQMHLENGKEVTTYSLGKYVSSQVKFEKDRALFYSETFERGQMCDETGLGRKMEVRLYCCGAAETTQGAAAPVFHSLQETTVCSYTMMACWQPLCAAGFAPLSSEDSKDTWAALRPMTGLCFQRAADESLGLDWVHEVCFERSARVFRQTSVTTSSGSDNKRSVTRIVQTDNKHMGSFVDNEITREREVTQIYNNGDWCDQTEGAGIRYSSKVRLACFLGRANSPEIVSFQVTSKCETTVLLHAPGLCASAAPQAKTTRTTTATAATKTTLSCVKM